MILKLNPVALGIFKRILFRSSFYAVAAYFISFMLEKLVMVAGATMYGYSVILEYEEVGVIADPSKWNQESVLIIYLFPYLIQAIIYTLLYINLQKPQVKPGFLRIFTLWMMFFIAFRFLGMLPAHLFFKTGIYHAFNWLYVGLTLKILIGFTGMVLFFLTSRRILNGIYFFFGTYNNNSSVIGIQNLLISSLLVPALATFFIPLIFFLPGLPKTEIIGLILVTLPVIYVFIRLFIANAELIPSRIVIVEKHHPLRVFIIILIMIVILRIILGFDFILN